MYQRYADTTANVFDGAGNISNARVWASTPGGASSWLKSPSETYHHYDAEGRLRLVDRTVDLGGNGAGAVFEEYRYDPFGRRVLVRLR